MFTSFSCVLLAISFTLNSVKCNSIVKFYPHIQANAENHNTRKYQTTNESSGQLVLRRGQVFIVELDLSKPLDANKDDVMIVATPINPLIPNYKTKPQNWQFQWDYTKSLMLDIFIPVNASVGRWKLMISLKKHKSEEKEKKNIIQEEIIVLFNPWNEGKDEYFCSVKQGLLFLDDTVYLESEAQRKEYVLNDVGEIYMGHPSKRYPKPWFYGQFEHKTFMAVLFVIEKYGLSPVTRSDPVMLSRAFSSLVNSNDNLGIIVGRWDGKYEPHKHPMSWISSSPVLEQYHQSNGEPVRYGQCWVFAAVLNTLCRAVGIPVRPVTDYGSAHDKNKNLVIDKYFKQVNGKPVEIQSELIWNFHVWNEAWMTRPDLGAKPEYNGWQMIDGTPQEASQGLFRCGPCPRKAAKYGLMFIDYDAPFLYSEVNADVITWMQDSSGHNMTKTARNKITIGQSILTKSVAPIWNGQNYINFEDITHDYKFHEGTPEEREYYRVATNALNLSYVLQEVTGRAIKDEILLNVTQLTKSDPMIGEPLKFNITFKNKMLTKKDIYVTVNISSVFYYGVVANTILYTPDMYFNLKPGQTKFYDVEVGVSEYIGKLVEFAMVNVDVMAHGNKRDDLWTEQRSVQFQKPKVNVTVKGDTKANIPITLDIRFKNPLFEDLTNCRLTIEGSGLTNKEPIFIGRIEANKLYHNLRTVTTCTKGNVQLLFNLNCDQLHDMLANIQVDVA